MARLLHRTLLVAGLALLLVTLFGGVASAHALLEGSDPPDGTSVATSPDAVRLRFSEPVRAVPSATRVRDAANNPVQTGVRVDGDTLVIALRPQLPASVYVVEYRVISADTHPVYGALSFGVRVAAGAAAAPTAASGGSPAVTAAVDVSRLLSWLGLVGLVGLAIVLGVLRSDLLTSPSVQRTLVAAWLLSYLAALAQLLAAGPLDTGQGMSSAFDWSTISGTLDSRLGAVLQARMLALAVLAVAFVGLRRRPTLWFGSLAGAAAAALVVTVAILGHPGAGPFWPWWTAIASVHLVATATWLAGLAVIVVLLARRRLEAGVVARWLALAPAAVALLIVTGLAQAWREAGILGALTSTSYGTRLLIKVALVAVMLVLALVARRWLRSPKRRASPFVCAELAAGAAVLTITSLLVNAVPARDSYSPSFSVADTAGAVHVQITVPHTRRGPQVVELRLTDAAGRPVDPPEVQAEFYNDAEQLGPLKVTFPPARAGETTSPAVPILVPGRWRLRVLVRTDEFTVGIADELYQVR